MIRTGQQVFEERPTNGASEQGMINLYLMVLTSRDPINQAKYRKGLCLPVSMKSTVIYSVLPGNAPP